MKNVVITGLGVVSSLGNSKDEIFTSLLNNQSGIVSFPKWKDLNGLFARLGAPAKKYDTSIIDRKKGRTMSAMSEMAFIATLDALNDAHISIGSYAGEDHFIRPDIDRILINMGSTTGSTHALDQFYTKYVNNHGPKGQLSTSFFKIMNHSVAANVASGLNYMGPLISSSSACSTSLQNIIIGTELIKTGLYDIVITGGADELHHTSVAVFDTVKAAAVNYNDNPENIPGPFDEKRDGLVVSEGAGVVILESEEHANKRNANIYGHILGGAYLCDGAHMSQPQKDSIIRCVRGALKNAGIKKEQIDYINAHATATKMGDLEEGKSINSIFSDGTPISSLKGHFGHSLAACGAIELIASLAMMEKNIIIPTRNLKTVDPMLTAGNYITNKVEDNFNTFLTNNFAFGGMNCSMVVSSE